MKKQARKNYLKEQLCFLKNNAKNYNLRNLIIFLELVEEEQKRYLLQFPFEQIALKTSYDEEKERHEIFEENFNEEIFKKYLKESLNHYDDILKNKGIVGFYDYFVELKLLSFDSFIWDNNFSNNKKIKYNYNNCYKLNIDNFGEKGNGFIEQFFIKVDEFACCPYEFRKKKYAPIVVSEDCDKKTNDKIWKIYFGSTDDWSYTGYFKTKEKMEECLIKIKHCFEIFPINALKGVYFPEFEFTN